MELEGWILRRLARMMLLSVSTVLLSPFECLCRFGYPGYPVLSSGGCTFWLSERATKRNRPLCIVSRTSPLGATEASISSIINTSRAERQRKALSRKILHPLLCILAPKHSSVCIPAPASTSPPCAPRRQSRSFLAQAWRFKAPHVLPAT
jgi:hypothetical protein